MTEADRNKVTDIIMRGLATREDFLELQAALGADSYEWRRAKDDWALELIFLKDGKEVPIIMGAVRMEGARVQHINTKKDG